MRATWLASALLAAALNGLGCGCAPGGAMSSADERLNAGLLKAGASLPAVTGVTLDGREISNATFAGKTVLLNTWFFN